MIYTFYSYKGGVGRSMALANVAEWLYLQGLRVVMIDWDLEAPGLENFFSQSPDELELIHSQLGLIDMLIAYKRLFPRLSSLTSKDETVRRENLREVQEGHEFLEILRQELPPISDTLYPIHAPATTHGEQAPALWLLPAGWRAGARFPMYAQAVQGFDWADFYASYHGETYFEWMRTQLVAEDLADIVLIDSRTGVTEMGGVCTRQMADVVVSFCVPSMQSLAGVEMMAQSFTRKEILLKRQRELAVVVVPARIEVSEIDARNRFEREFRERLDQFIPSVFHTVRSTFWDLMIQYIPKYAYAEKLAINAPDSARELENAYKKLTAHLALLAHGQSALRIRKSCAAELQRIFGQLLPSVLIGYIGGEEAWLAQELRSRLVEQGLALLSEPVDLASSRGEWRYLKTTLDQSTFLLLTITTAAQQSATLRQEWRYARQQGVCVGLVHKGPLFTTLDGPEIPRWLQQAQRYDLDQEWEKLVRFVQSPCQATRIPFMAPDLPERYVERPEILRSLKEAVLTSSRVGLWGPPGSGKSLLAAALCQDEDVIAAFEDGILWLTLSVEPDILREMTTLYAVLTGERPSFVDEAEATVRLTEKLRDRHCLLVLDDVWDGGHLQAFLQASKQSSCVITTRNANVVSAIEAKLLPVSEILPSEALQLLTAQLPLTPKESTLTSSLVQRLSKWPLILKLANAEIGKRMAQGATAADALASLDKALDQQGVLALDQPATLDPHQSIAQAVALSLDQLTEDERGRYFQLASFPAETDIPLKAVSERWGYSEFEAERRLQRLADLSLLTYDLRTKTTRLYSALHSYSRHQATSQADHDALLEAALARLSPAERAEVRRIFSRLVRVASPAEGGTDTLIHAKLAEFSPAAQKIVHALAEDRLVVIDPSSGTGDTVRLEQESFLRNSKLLRAWLDDDREFLIWRQQLRANMADWEGTSRDQGALLSGAPLKSATVWLDKRPEDLNEAEHSYIRASLAAERRSENRRRVTIGAIAALLVLLTFGAIVWWQNWQTQLIKAEIADIFSVANELTRIGETGPALSWYSRALERDPGFVEAYVRRGILYDKEGKFDRAIEDYTKAISLKKDYPEAYFNRGISFVHKGDHAKAIADYDQAIALDSDNPVFYVNRGLALENTGNIDLAIADYSKAIELKPDYAEAYFNRGAAYQNKKEEDKAIADFQRVITLNTDSQTIQAARARLRQLGSQAELPPRVVAPKVHLLYNDSRDKEVLDAVAKTLASKGYGVQGVRETTVRTEGDVQYFHQEDEQAAADIKRVVESSLAKEGVKSSLTLHYLDAAELPVRIGRDGAESPKAEPGKIEVWLPSLSQRSPTRGPEQRDLKK